MKRIAVRVTSTKQFDLLIKEMKSRGWKPAYADWTQAPTVNETPEIVLFCDAYHYAHLSDCTVLEFPQFASIAGIALPPNEIVIKLGSGDAVVSKERVTFLLDGGYGVHYLSAETIREIHTAIQSLNG